MRDELPDWMDAEEEPTPRPARLRRLLALAAVPWVLVAVLIARSASGDDLPASGDDHPTAADHPTADDDLPASADDLPASADDHPTAADDHPTATDDLPASVDDLPASVDDLTLEVLAWEGGYRQTPGDGVVVSVAALTARAWLTGLDPHLEIEGLVGPDGPRYAEHLVFEALERPAPGAAVVTFAAVVLTPGDTPTADVARLAVPVDETGDHPQPAGAPWPLPAPDLELRSPAVTDELDEEHWPAARAALAAAGFDDVELRGLQRTAGWPVLATVRRPGHDTDLVVWLRRHLQQFVVAGLPLQDALADASRAAGTHADPEDRP